MFILSGTRQGVLFSPVSLTGHQTAIMHEINMRILTTLERGSYALNAVFSATVGASVDFPGNLDHKCGLPDDGTHQPFRSRKRPHWKLSIFFVHCLSLSLPKSWLVCPLSFIKRPLIWRPLSHICLLSWKVTFELHRSQCRPGFLKNKTT